MKKNENKIKEKKVEQKNNLNTNIPAVKSLLFTGKQTGQCHVYSLVALPRPPKNH